MVQWLPDEEAFLVDSCTLTYREIEGFSPHARPLDFPAPTVSRGARMSVHSPNRKSGRIESVRNVLIRLEGRQKNLRSSSPKCNEKTGFVADEGYLIRKKIANAVYGSVRVCVVMKPRRLLPRETMMLSGQGDSLASISENEKEFDNDETDNKFRVDLDEPMLWEYTDKLVVVKMISWASVTRLRGRHLEDPIKEAAAMQLLGNYHDHTISVIDILQDNKYLYIVTPYYAGGDLYSHTMSAVHKKSGRLEEAEARYWFRQILSGLLHLQKKGICHRDISLENILMHKNKCVIIDFGLCLRVPYVDPNNNGNVTDVSSGTSRCMIKAVGEGGNWTYVAPEIVARHKYFDGFAVDLWSAGVILFIMLVGVAPFKWAHESDKHFKIMSSGKLKQVLLSWKIDLSEDAFDLLQNMFWKDARNRLNLYQVINHPWVNVQQTHVS